MKPIKRNLFLATVLLCFLLVFAFGIPLFNAEPYTAEPYNVEEENNDYFMPASEEEHYYIAENDMDDIPIIMQSASFAWFPIEERLGQAMLIVHGTVTGKSEPFLIENIHYGGRLVFTDYYIEIHEVLRGETSTREITLRVEGGVTDELIFIVDYVPEFEIGGQYILLLSTPVGGLWDTPGYYYYLSGQSPLSVFVLEENSRSLQSLANDEDIFVSYANLDEDGFSFAELRRNLESINATVPIRTVEDVRQEAVDVIRGSTERGVYTVSAEELETEIYEILNAPPYQARIVR
ncbi:MAG: hypothetical protein FWE28_09015 [Oscillospiraceae bacterium]|nr:hypothetical protein [Oscillospiraceae bacterium]